MTASTRDAQLACSVAVAIPDRAAMALKVRLDMPASASSSSVEPGQAPALRVGSSSSTLGGAVDEVVDGPSSTARRVDRQEDSSAMAAPQSATTGADDRGLAEGVDERLVGRRR